MAVLNSVGNSLTGLTGTGAFVGANTPTLITPVLGASTATSITFGGSVLNAYTETTSFSPTVIFDTLGDLSVSYAVQSGSYARIGSLVIVNVRLQFTPTYTTSAGSLRVSSIPISINASVIPNGPAFVSGATFPAGTTSVEAVGTAGTGNFAFVGCGSGASVTTFGVTQFLTGVSYLVSFTASYLA